MTLPLEEDPRPPYVQAAAVLRGEITSGRLKPGDKLPSARDLQDRYGIASSTVQNALRMLKSEGLIYSVQGRGSFVRQNATGPTTSGSRAASSPRSAGSGEAGGRDEGEAVKELKARVALVEEQLSTLQQTQEKLLTLVQQLLGPDGK
ncbi:GntR family transcriptional regulator [Actinacidiphila sp. bgisy145]|uniref:GntR family transcriptional regulator n=1 Tax=Actinacidiphila sp. bgisy145 TaxID=3413792 RepID=UPI003EBA9BCC